MQAKSEHAAYPIALNLKPLKNAPFRPISALHSDFNPRNIQDIPVVEIRMRLDLERN